MRKVNLVYGTVYGNAQFVAEEAEQALQKQGWQTQLFAPEQLDNFVPEQESLLLVICSTTGQGDIPEDIAPWFMQLKDQAPYLPQLQYAVIALGDSSYETFCQAGVQFDELFTELGAKQAAELLKIDACETMEPEVEAKSWLQNLSQQLA
ncbi:flavodoxin [Shewanella waksmanii]|uniref:flavodoxin n=1 Tax=Shewanella waksmanii TaxID=213783 RepID=UPI003736F799